MRELIENESIVGTNVLRVEEWSRYPWLRHGFSIRSGGVSTVYGGNSLNLGWTKEDDPALVAENRRRFLRAAAGETAGNAGFVLVTVRQVHSGIIQVIKEADGAGEGKLQTMDGKAVLEGDGLLTGVPGVMIAVGTADCVPVLVADVQNRVVAAFHAGWRGTVAQIVENGIETMRSEYGSHPDDLIAAIGPSIGACCYSVGNEVREQFRSQFSYANELLREVSGQASPQIHVDLWEANRRQLLDAGVDKTHITAMAQCTACTSDEQGALRYFSHRAERGNAGRMLAAIGIASEG